MEASDRLIRIYRRLPPTAVAVALIILAVALGNVVYLAGAANGDPISWTSNISHLVCRHSCGPTAIDPNVAFITQPLGHLAAMDLLHGHWPWWNHFEGLGQPLAGEMQSAALLPLTLLLALPAGLLWFHVTLEVIAGVSTYLLVRRLQVPHGAAVTAGVLFALNGTFAWVGNAVLNPIAFLPMLILGIEMIFDAARDGTRPAWYVAALALALSLYAGFPEVAYINGLLALSWAVVRLFSLPRARRRLAASRVALASLVGLAISLPVLVPFLDFLAVGDVGQHAANGFGHSLVSAHALPILLDPYSLGTIMMGSSAVNSVPGYFTASVAALSIVGLVGTRLRALRLMLAGWIVLTILGALDVLHLRAVWNLLPMMDNIIFNRYIWPSCEFAMIVLAALGIADMADALHARRRLSLGAAIALLLTSASAVAVSNLGGTSSGQSLHGLMLWLNIVPFLAVLAILAVAWLADVKVTMVLLGLVLVAESIVMFIAPSTRAPVSVAVDQAPLAYLRQHQGGERFLSLGVLYPNWGSQFGLNALNAIDLPFPTLFSQLVVERLLPTRRRSNQFISPRAPEGLVNLADHLAAYEDASVAYVLVPRSTGMTERLRTLGVTRVFHDDLTVIYRLPHPRPLYSTSGGGCHVVGSRFDAARVSCTHRGGTLIRTELSMPGWRAAVNGRPASVATSDGVYQDVVLPRGATVVDFNFLPPHEELAAVAGSLGLIYLVASWIRNRRPPRRPRHRRRRGAGRPSGPSGTPDADATSHAEAEAPGPSQTPQAPAGPLA